MSRERFGVNIHLPDDKSTAFEECKALGVGWIRIDINWCDIEAAGRGKFDWRNVDRVVAQAASKGLKIFATLAYTPGWASQSNDRANPPTSSADWANFVSVVVSRYTDRITHWGVWNEPNHPDYFKGSMTDYVDKILIPGVESIRKACPNCQILGPDLTDMGKLHKPNHWSKWMTEIFKREKKYGKPFFDIITHHIYKPTSHKKWYFRILPIKPTIFTMLDGNPLTTRFFGNGPSLKNHLQVCDVSDRPVWLTEIGWDSNDITEKKQDQSYREFIKGMSNRQWIEKIFFYELMDDPNRTDNVREGLIDENLNHKQAFSTLQKACQMKS